MIDDKIAVSEIINCKVFHEEEVEELSPLAKLVKRFGSSISLGFLDEHCTTFSIPEVEGVIGYNESYGCAVVYGDPVCSRENAPILASAFHQFCRERGVRILYAMVSQGFADWAMQRQFRVRLEATEELFLDPANYPKSGPMGRTLKKKVNHSIRDGVSVEEYLGYDIHLEKAMEEMTNQWVEGRKGLQVYLAKIELFKNRDGKRWFYAKRRDDVVGVLLLNRVDAFDGWVLNMAMAAQDAPIGTSEHLVVTALEAFINEECRYLTFGPSIIGELRELAGLPSYWKWIAQKLFSLLKRTVNLEGRRTFWKKFNPQSAPSYYLFQGKSIKLRELLALRKSMHISF